VALASALKGPVAQTPCGVLAELRDRCELLREATLELSSFPKPVDARERLLLAFRVVVAAVRECKRREEAGLVEAPVGALESTCGQQTQLKK